MDATGMPAELARRRTRVLRPRDAAAVYAHPRAEIARLRRAGLLHPLATGYYAIVPYEHLGDASWAPGLEAAAGAIAACDYGPDSAVLMGLSAARLHGALPRAVAVAVVAVPARRPPLRLSDRQARVVFVQRSVARLDAELVATELGSLLVTGVEQTALDLTHRPLLGGLGDEAVAAARALVPRCDPTVVDELAAAQRLRAARDRLLGDRARVRIVGA